MRERLANSLLSAVFVVGALATGGCGQQDCTKLADPTQADWCRFEQAAEAAERGDIQGAISRIESIQDPMVRAAAIDRVFTIAAGSVPQETAAATCATLPEGSYRESCLRAWDRPHLWER